MNYRSSYGRAPDAECLKALGLRLCELIEAGQNEKADFEPRWRQNKANYENVPLPCVSRFIPDAEDVPFPLVQPRIDALRDHIVGTICSQSPFMLAHLRGSSQRQEQLENALQFFFQLGRLEDALKEVSPIVGYTNTGILRAQFVASVHDFLPDQTEELPKQKSGPLGFAGLAFDVIHPDDFVCVGSNIFGINTAQLVGHRFWLQRVQIEERIAAGRYLAAEGDLIASDGPAPDASNRHVVNQQTGDPSDDKIELWEVIFRCKPSEVHGSQVPRSRVSGPEAAGRRSKVSDFERYYKATIAVDSKSILCVEEYEFSRPWYVALRWKPRQHDGFWSAGSVAQDLQGLHAQYQFVNNILIYGSMLSAFQPLVTKGEFEKNQKYGPGQLISMSGGELQPPGISFNPGVLLPMIPQIERNADAVCRLTSNYLAQMYSRDMTATEANYLAAGQQSGISGFISTFGSGLIDLSDLCCELLYANWDFWAPLYGKEIFGEQSEMDRQDLLLPIHWDLSGKSPANTPQQTALKMQSLLQLSQAEQQAGIQTIMKIVGQQFGPQAVQAIQAQLASSPDSPMLDRREIIRTYINNLGLTNSSKILMPEEEEKPDAAMGSMAGQPGMAGALTALAQASRMPQVGAQEPGPGAMPY